MTRTILFLVLTALTSQSFGQTDILGCMDSTACNYNVDATVDDDSCDFCSCSDGTLFETSEAGYGVEIETIAVHSAGDLSGMTTYRLYLTVPSENDEITSFTGNDEFALSLATTTSFYQESVFGGVTPENISAAAIGFIPNLAYDSWVTVGLDGPASSLETTTSLLPGAWSSQFENGNSFSVDDGTGSGWYVLPGATNSVAGSDLRILFAQLTTDGIISGSFRSQVFPEGDQINDVRPDITFLMEGVVCGCTDSSASNYDATANSNDGSCEYDVYGCTISAACNYDPLATIYDGSCDFFSCIVFGCMDITACNYNPEATYAGSCDYLSCIVFGCSNELACNYDPAADFDDGSCEFTSCAGCTDSESSNYDSTATVDDGSCAYPGCIDVNACNYDATANTDDGSCDYTSCLISGCMISAACNFNPEAQVSDDSCEFPETFYDCNGDCLNDIDGDGICNEFEIAGCTDELANNYNPAATDNNGSCIYPVPGCLDDQACNYYPLADLDDNSCDYTSCAGCLQPSACNYDSEATISDGSCTYAEAGYDCDGVCLVDTDGDGICDMFEIPGCLDTLACNYDEEATDSAPSQCSYASPNFDCDGNSLLPSFVNPPANASFEACNVPFVEDVEIEAVVSDFVAAYESVYNSNDCYENNPTPTIVSSEFIVEGSCDNEYTSFRSWTATDCAGYSVTYEQIITVSDNIAPTLDVPADMNVTCDAVADAEFGDATSYDNCGESTISVVEVIVDGACQGSYEIHRTFTATDDCGNSSSGLQTITVVDDVAPELVLPDDYTVECSDNIVLAPANASDNCGSFTIDVVETTIPGNNAGNYLIERTFTAIDDCG
ncbi:MAG: hypothetical protein HOM41_03720, partial [Flavobacteriales bacterium]|nr:hypothetical protein [Flavobacteriales bacterium]